MSINIVKSVLEKILGNKFITFLLYFEKRFVDISAFPDLVLQGLVRVHHSDGGQDKLHLKHPVPALLKI